MLVGLVLLVISYFVTHAIAKKFPNIFILVVVVFLTVITCLILGMAYVLELTQGNREAELRAVLGTGFWFSIFGSVYGAYKGRKISLTNKETDQ